MIFPITMSQCQNSLKFLSFLYFMKTSHVIMIQIFMYDTPGHA